MTVNTRCVQAFQNICWMNDQLNEWIKQWHFTVLCWKCVLNIHSENNLLTKFWVLSLLQPSSATASAVYRARAASTQSPPKSCKIWTVKALLSIEKHLIVILNFLHFIVQQSGRGREPFHVLRAHRFSCTTVSKVLANSSGLHISCSRHPGACLG